MSTRNVSQIKQLQAVRLCQFNFLSRNSMQIKEIVYFLLSQVEIKLLICLLKTTFMGNLVAESKFIFYHTYFKHVLLEGTLYFLKLEVYFIIVNSEKVFFGKDSELQTLFPCVFSYRTICILRLLH